MSIVGPRPHPIPLNLQSKDQINNYLLRHLIKPGITGWAQVNGSRGEVKEAFEMTHRECETSKTALNGVFLPEQLKVIVDMRKYKSITKEEKQELLDLLKK